MSYESDTTRDTNKRCRHVLVDGVCHVCATNTEDDHGYQREEPDEENTIRSLIITTRQLAEIPEPEALIDGYLLRDTLTWLGGAPGAYKSFMAIELACVVASGTTWRGVKVKPGRVLYVIAEGRSGAYKRVEAWMKASGTIVQIDWLPAAPQIGTASWQHLVDHVRVEGYDLIVLDTQSRLTTGHEENDASAATRIVGQLTTLKEASGACVLLVHHLNRGGTNLRGSSVIDGAADTVIEMVKLDGVARVRNTKQKDIPEFGEFYVRAADTARSMVLVECEKPSGWEVRLKASRSR